MKRIVLSTINNTLKPFGVRFGSTAEHQYLLGTQSDAQKYARLVAEVHDLYVEDLFPELPRREGRLPLLAGLIGTGVGEAVYVLEYLHRSLKFGGDICEFGVAQGATSALLANEVRDTDKSLWLFDTFAGLPKPGEEDELIDDIFDLKDMAKYEGQMSCSRDMVEARLRDISFPSSRLNIVPGPIEETVARTGLPDKVCFAYVDFDFYSGILTALNFLDGRLATGGFVVVDDYGFFSAGAKTAVDEFVGANGGLYELILPRKSAGHFCILGKKQ